MADAYEASDDIGAASGAAPSELPDTALSAPPLWTFNSGSERAFQPTGDPSADHFTQAIRAAIGLDNPEQADPSLQPTINLLQGLRSQPLHGLLGDIQTLSSGNAPSAAGGGDPRSAAADAAQKQLDDFEAMMIPEEGRRPDVYADSRGVLTVGIGHKVLPSDNLNEGDVVGDDRIDQFFNQDASAALAHAQAQAADAGIADPAFTARLGSVNFQLGADWRQTFPKTWSLIMSGDYSGAADEVARGSHGGPSDWLVQTPKRVRSFQAALRALPQ